MTKEKIQGKVKGHQPQNFFTKLLSLIRTVFIHRVTKFLSFPTVLVILIVVGAKFVPFSTPVRIEVNADRIDFIVGPLEEDAVKILGAQDLRSLQVKKFSKISIPFKSVTVADPKTWNRERRTFEKWTPIPKAGGSLEFAASHRPMRPAALIFKPDSSKFESLALDSLQVQNGQKVIMQSSSLSPGLNITWVGPSPKAVVSLPTRNSSLEVVANHSAIAGIPPSPNSDDSQVSYLVRAGASKNVPIEGQLGGLVIAMRFDQKPEPLKGQRIPLKKVFFLKPDEPWETRKCSQLSEAKITYKNYPGHKGVQVSPQECLWGKGLYLIEMNYIEGGMQFILDGSSGNVRRALPEDGEVPPFTLFDAVWYDPEISSIVPSLWGK